MDPYHLFVLQCCFALFLSAVAVILVLMVGVKVGEFLEAKRQVQHILDEKAELRRQKALEALASDQDDTNIQRWEEFYNELR